MKDINSFVDEIARKFNYSASLSSDLKRILPAMLDGKSEDKENMLLDALKDTKIYILPYDATVEDLNSCKAESFGNNNQGVTFQDGEESEYNNTKFPDGAYISEPVFDDRMNIIGRNRMLYVKELGKFDKLREVYGSDINLSHLIHEMGHMWAAQKDEYVQQEDGSFVQNVGAGFIQYNVDRNNRSVSEEKIEGLFIEETLNTILEEKTILNVTGAKDIKELQAKGYIISSYQGAIKNIMESYVDKFGQEAFDELRFNKDRKKLDVIEQSLADTESWQILGYQKYIDTKQARIMQNVDSLEVPEEAKNRIKGIFDKYHDVFFANTDGITPIQKLDNVLTQIYNFNTVKYNFGILGNEKNLECYKTVISAIYAEANVLRLEAKDVDFDKYKEQNMMEQLISGIKDQKEVFTYYNEETKEHEQKMSPKEATEIE